MKIRSPLAVSLLVALTLLIVPGSVYALLLGCGGARESGPSVRSPTYNVPRATLATAGTKILAEDRSFEIAPGGFFNTPYWSSCPDRPTTENYGEAEKGGARRVLVTHPGYAAAPLHGVLAFCRTYEGFHGSASRLYRIEVPQEYVDATDGGRVSVVYETYDYEGGKHPAWVLWLSREPLPPTSGVEYQGGGSHLSGSTQQR